PRHRSGAEVAPGWPGGNKGKGAAMRRQEAATDARDRGSVAVEFALLLPVLLLIIFGVIDFGRAINAQITLTQAAREGARLDALGYSTSAVQTRAQSDRHRQQHRPHAEGVRRLRGHRLQPARLLCLGLAE